MAGLGSSAPRVSRMGVSASLTRFLLIERLPATVSCIHNGMSLEKYPSVGFFPLPAKLPRVFDGFDAFDQGGFFPEAAAFCGWVERFFCRRV